MEYETIIYRKHDGIADITINCADKMKAMFLQLIDEPLDMIEQIGNDNEVAIITLPSTIG